MPFPHRLWGWTAERFAADGVDLAAARAVGARLELHCPDCAGWASVGRCASLFCSRDHVVHHHAQDCRVRRHRAAAGQAFWRVVVQAQGPENIQAGSFILPVQGVN
jgi:hypothetical protein